MIAADSEADYLICWFIINKPQPNLSIQGTLSSVQSVSPE